MPRKPSSNRTTASAAISAPQPSPSSPQTLYDMHALPRLLIFDLDYTLWPFWVDTHVQAPLKSREAGMRVTDRSGEPFSFYSDVPQILRDARARRLPMALASRTETPELARDMLKLLVVDGGRAEGGGGGGEGKLRGVDCFDYVQIYPGSKTAHIAKIQKQSGVDFADMLFFDDEERNRDVEVELGVLMYLVRDGLTSAEVDRAIREWRAKRGKDGSYIP